MSTKGAKTFTGSNVSQREYVIQAKKTGGPFFQLYLWDWMVIIELV